MQAAPARPAKQLWVKPQLKPLLTRVNLGLAHQAPRAQAQPIQVSPAHQVHPAQRLQALPHRHRQDPQPVHRHQARQRQVRPPDQADDSRMHVLKKYFITGLVIWVPLVITIWVLSLLVTTLESVVPGFLSPQALFGFEIPGFRVLVVAVVLFVTGLLAANFLGRGILNIYEKILGRIPLVRNIYQSVKQVSDTVLSPNGQAFRQAVLVPYPSKGLWTMALLTGSPAGEIADHLQAEHVSVYVPSTPNPTSGVFIMVPRSEIIPLSMSVDSALKYIVSMGVVAPVESKTGKTSKINK